MSSTAGRIAGICALITGLAIIPYCSQSRSDRAAVEKADRDVAETRAAAGRAAKSAAEAAAASKAAEHAADDVRPAQGAGF